MEQAGQTPALRKKGENSNSKDQWKTCHHPPGRRRPRGSGTDPARSGRRQDPEYLYIVEDGEEALDYLLRRGRYEDPKSSPRPDMLLLDLNMPKVDGKQVLEEIRKHDDLRHLTVCMLTTSAQEEDVLRSYDLGVSSYITKPVEMGQFFRVIQNIGEYWFQIVVSPPKGD